MSSRRAMLKKAWSRLGGRAAAVRLLAIAVLLASPLLPAAHRPGRGRSVVYVVDRSLSVSEAELQQAEAFVAEAIEGRGDIRVGVVAFDNEASMLRPVDGDQSTEAPRIARRSEVRRGSDLGGALRLAEAALPRAGERRMVLLSDGRGTGSDGLQEVEAARRAGVLVDVTPLGGGARSTSTVASLRLEQTRVSEGEPVTATALLRGRPGEELQLSWSRDGVPLGQSAVTLDEQGRAEVRRLDSRPGRGRHAYSAAISTEGEATGSPLDRGRALVVVEGRPRVLLLTSTGEQPALLLEALSQAGAEVETRTLDQGQPTAEALAEVDLVVLADVAIARRGEVTLLAGLDERGQQALLDYVSERGGGLLALGGIFGFGPEYAGQPISRLLPVEVEDLGELENPSVAMAIQLDRSGSMSARVGGHTKLELAIEAALAAAGSLRTYDRVAIGAVDEVTAWFQPLGHLSDLVRRQEQIRSMGPGGGGIYVYTALADAYGLLQTAEEPIRHVVIFSDTADSEEQVENCPFGPCSEAGTTALDLARTARISGVTTSVVGIGGPGDQDTRFLRDLAVAGGGRFYLTSQATDLRRIFISETRAATRSSLREEHISLEASDAHQILDGVDLGAMPAIEGFVQTSRRVTADTALVTPDGRPILASWRYGLGTVVGWTTDCGQRWTTDWASWEGAGQMMRQMVRFTLRRGGGHGVEAAIALRDGAVEVTVEAPESSRGEEVPASIQLDILDAAGLATRREAPLEQVEPGRWVARSPIAGEPFAVARVLDRNGQQLTEVVGSQEGEEELVGEGVDERALRDLSRVGAGLYAPDPAATLRLGGPRGSAPLSLWPFALLLSALLVCVDLWLRRLGRGRRDALSNLSGAALVPLEATGPAVYLPTREPRTVEVVSS